MKKKSTAPTLVTFLLDRSGSMAAIWDSTIESFNAYLDSLRSAKDMTFSFLQFDSSSIDTHNKNTPIAEVKPLTRETFVPRGGTPLIDAAYKTINAVEKAVAAREGKPNVVICIQTDGEENSSREFTWDQLQDLIKEKTALGWQFNFMGASIDAYQQAQRMGLGRGQTMSYESSSMASSRAAFAASGAATMRFASGAADTTAYTPSEKMASGDRFDPDKKASKAAPTKAAKPKPIVDDIQL